MDQMAQQVPSPAEAPQPQQRPMIRTWHGIARADEFAWLKAENWLEVMRYPATLDPEIRAYLEAENAYADAVLADTEALQAAVLAEMKGRIKEDDTSVPIPDGPFAYFERYREGGQHPLICRQGRYGGAEEVLLDGNALARDRSFFELGASRHSPDHKLLAWTSDEAGSEFYTIRIEISRPDPISPILSLTRQAHRFGAQIARASIMSGWTASIAPPASIATGWGRRRVTTP